MEDNTCPGCQRNDIHKMCPAYGTPFYMSGIPYPEKLAKIVDILSPEDKQIIFEACNSKLDSNMAHNDTEWHHTTMWCPHCDKDTVQDVKWSGHERDSTHDKAVCLTCMWEYNGYNGEYEPPYE